MKKILASVWLLIVGVISIFVIVDELGVAALAIPGIILFVVLTFLAAKTLAGD